MLIEIKNTNLSFAHEYDVTMYHFTSLITSFISLTIYSSTSNIFHVNKLLTLTQAKMLQNRLGLNISSIETNSDHLYEDLADFLLLRYHGLKIDL